MTTTTQRHLGDEFDGPAGALPDPGYWTALEGGGGWGNEELQYYTGRCENACLDGQGNLVITARRENRRDARGRLHRYTSARLLSRDAITYGRLEARIRLEAGQGLWPAFWTVGADQQSVGWPEAGEIDVLEATNRMRHVLGSAHGTTRQGKHWAVHRGHRVPGGLDGAWHTHAVVWGPRTITWWFDGRRYAVLRRSELPSNRIWPFDRPQRVQLNLAVGGTWPGRPDASTPFPARMTVDYVRWYPKP